MAKMEGAMLQNGLYRISTVAYPEHFLYMQDNYTGNVRTCRGDPGSAGWWQLINHPSSPGFYMISPWCWPDCFIFVEKGLSGNVRGWNHCDPGLQGYFKLVPRIDERGHGTDQFFVTTQRWEDDWFIYVESGLMGNLSSWNGDPGPQGWFILEVCQPSEGKSLLPVIGKTVQDLAKMPRLDSAASGYSGPSKELASPQLLSEIRLEVTHAEGKSLAWRASERTLTFHVDQARSFVQRIGRQYQRSFFDEYVPDRDLWNSLSRCIFELRLDPPQLSPTVHRVTQSGTVCVGKKLLNANESTLAGDETLISLGTNERSGFLVFKIGLRRSTQQEIAATCEVLPGARRGGKSWFPSLGMSSVPESRPIGDFDKHRSECSPLSPSSIVDNCMSRAKSSFYGYMPQGAIDSRPPTAPQLQDIQTVPHFDHDGPTKRCCSNGTDLAGMTRPSGVLPPPFELHSSPNRPNVDTTPPSRDRSDCLPWNSSASSSGPRVSLECIFSAGGGALPHAQTTIPLVVDESVSIGRAHQTNFFEKLLPVKDDLGYISRSHLTARASKRGSVNIVNQSQNAVKIDEAVLNIGQSGEIKLGSSLKFTARDRTLLTFFLKYE